MIEKYKMMEILLLRNVFSSCAVSLDDMDDSQLFFWSKYDFVVHHLDTSRPGEVWPSSSDTDVSHLWSSISILRCDVMF